MPQDLLRTGVNRIDLSEGGGRFWTGFEGGGVWQARSPFGPWTSQGLDTETVTDLAYDLGRGMMFAATSNGMVVPNGPAFDGQGTLYATDSILGSIWRMQRDGANAESWFSHDWLMGCGEEDPLVRFRERGTIGTDKV